MTDGTWDWSVLPGQAFVPTTSSNLTLASATSAPTPNLTISWAGVTQSQAGNSEPPDSNIAAGTGNIITVVNTYIDIYNKSGTHQNDQTLNAFFNLADSQFLFDPRIT